MAGSLARSPRLAGRFPDAIATRGQLLALGMTPTTIDRRCRPGGPWGKLLIGILQLDGKRTTARQYRRAALAHAGAEAMITGACGAGLHGIRVPQDRRVPVLISADRRVTSRDFVVVIRTTRLPEPVLISGLPVAPAARCLADAAARMDDVDAIRAMFADAVQCGACRVADLVAEFAEPRRPYTARARSVLVEILDGVRSAAEAWARELALRSSLPPPRWNVALHGPDGTRLGVVDAYWDDVGLAWEIQSRRFHLSPQDQARDVRKQARLAAAGILVLPTMAARLVEDPHGVIDELTAAHGRAARSPAPAVTATLWRR